MNFNERLSNIRTDRDLKQKDIYEQLNIAQQTYSQYETGQNEPSFATLKNICDILNVSSDYLLGLSNVTTPINTLLPKIDELSESDIQKVLDYIDVLVKASK